MSLDQKSGYNDLFIVLQIKSHFCEYPCYLLFQNGILPDIVQSPEACMNYRIYGVPVPITGWSSVNLQQRI